VETYFDEFLLDLNNTFVITQLTMADYAHYRSSAFAIGLLDSIIAFEAIKRRLEERITNLVRPTATFNSPEPAFSNACPDCFVNSGMVYVAFDYNRGYESESDSE
jgi:hypothetical protein